MMESDMVEVGVLSKHPSKRSLVVQLSLRCMQLDPIFVSLASVDRVIVGEWEYAKLYQKRSEKK